MQNNILVNKGDFITIKIEAPIVPADTILLGYFIHLDGIIDRLNIVKGEFAIVLSSIDNVDDKTVVWYELDKQTFDSSEDSYFCDICNKQKEPYYIYFRFTKVEVYPTNISLSKISLKIANRQNEDGSYGDRTKYPFYERSIFRKNNRLYALENLRWAYNVLNKTKGSGIVPTFIDRGKDFNTFWEWITHFYAIIVNFSRQFKDISKKEELLTEYLKQKDVYPNTKISIYEVIEITPEGTMKKFIRPLEDIFNVYEEFRERGTKDTYKKIQTLLETTSKDLFYCNYLSRKDTSWYLNRYSPMTNEIINDIILTKMEEFSREISYYNADLKLLENDLGLSLYYIDMNENNNIVINFNSTPPKSLAIYLLLRASELNSDIYTLNGIIKYSNINGIGEISYNKGYIFIKDIDPKLKKVTIPIRFKNRLFSKLNQGKFFDVSPLGRAKDSFFFENKINVGEKQYDLDKLAIRQVVAYNVVSPTAFTRVATNTNERVLESAFTSIKLKGTKADSYYYVGSFSTSNEETVDGHIFKSKLIIKEYPSGDEVCGFNLSIPTPRDGFIELDELNNSGITGNVICVLNYDTISVTEISNYFFRVDLSENVKYDLYLDYTLGRLPFNLNFLNSSFFWLNYIKNNSPYSFEKICDIINQKFVPYNAKSLILQNDKIRQIVSPLVFTKFEIEDPNYHNSNLGNIICKVKGGVGPYTFYLKNVKTSEIVESRNNGYFYYVSEGKYEVSVTDSAGITIVRKNVLVKNLSSITAEISVKADGVYIDIRGGKSPYYLHYSKEGPILKKFTTEEILNASSQAIKLTKIPFALDKDFYIYITDATSTNLDDILNLYYITKKVIVETAKYIRLEKQSSTLNYENNFSDSLGISSNTNWNLEAPEYISFNRKEGNDDSVVIFNTDGNYSGRINRANSILFKAANISDVPFTINESGVGEILSSDVESIEIKQIGETIHISGRSNAKLLTFTSGEVGEGKIPLPEITAYQINGSIEAQNGVNITDDIGATGVFEFSLDLIIPENTGETDLVQTLSIAGEEITVIIMLNQLGVTTI